MTDQPASSLDLDEYQAVLAHAAIIGTGDPVALTDALVPVIEEIVRRRVEAL